MSDLPQSIIKKLQVSYENLYKAWGIADGKKLTILKFEEMLEETLEASFSIADDRYTRMFEQVDINSDGEISLKEWKIHNTAFGISSEHAEKSFEAMDANGDGKISVQEFVDYHKEFFYSTEDKMKSSLLFGPLM